MNNLIENLATEARAAIAALSANGLDETLASLASIGYRLADAKGLAL